jgi:hypothetical protein
LTVSVIDLVFVGMCCVLGRCGGITLWGAGIVLSITTRVTASITYLSLRLIWFSIAARSFFGHGRPPAPAHRGGFGEYG